MSTIGTKATLLPVMLLCASGFAMAQNPNDFVEIDGNAVVNGTACTSPNTPVGCKDDWNLLNGTGGTNPTGSAGGSLARTFASGDASVAVFTGGGSKDPIDIPSWKWKNGGTPDKDAITNGYAAAYQAPNGHLMIAFGADRFAVNGDANIGFWFFQQNVHPVGTTGGGFSGQHTTGDIFVVSAFTQGGGVSTITVYAWDPTCTKASGSGPGSCGDSNLRLKFISPNSATCVGIPTGCADVNLAPIDVSWPYLSKFGSNSTQIPTGGFYEGGVDVTALIGGTECFTSFLVETRSSQTPSAVLKDFISGSFDICKMTATKTCAGNGTVNAGGASIHYAFNGTINNTGFATLANATIVDSLPAGSSNVVFKKGTSVVTTSTCPTGSAAGAVCANMGGVAAGATVNWSVEFDSTSTNVQNNAIAVASTSGGTPGACGTSGTLCSASTGDTCSTPVSNSITISKACGVPTGYPNAPLQGTVLQVSGSTVVARVNFSGTITNSGQTTLSNIALADSPAANITVAWPDATKPGVVPAGGTAKYSGTYLPGSFAGDGTVAGRYSFSDEIKLTNATAAIGTSPGADAACVSSFTSGAQSCAAATCNICPGGAICQGN